jgi:hypothetical protein
VHMGFHFKQIKQFIQQEQYPTNGAKSKYRCALCTGLHGGWHIEAVFPHHAAAAAGLLQPQYFPADSIDRSTPQRVAITVTAMLFQLLGSWSPPCRCWSTTHAQTRLRACMFGWHATASWNPWLPDFDK